MGVRGEAKPLPLLLLLLWPLLSRAGALGPGPVDATLLTSPCGQREMRPLIVGGEEAALGRWPWQALVMARDGQFCGGSLVSRRWVLSAAHCFERFPEVSKWTVRLGELSLKSSFWNWRPNHHYKVKKIVVNPHARGVLQDIALVQLASPVPYNKNIHPVCVPSSSSVFQHRPDCWVTGWGWLREDQKLQPPYRLREVQVTILNNSRCRELFSMPTGRSFISDDMICAGAEDGSVDTCSGDSGGPLVCDLDGRWYQVGVVSWGLGCGWPRRPGVYTNVSSFFPWIQLSMSCSGPRPGLSLPLLSLSLPWAFSLLCPG